MKMINKRIKKKVFIIPFILFIIIHLSHLSEYFIKNFIYKRLSDEGVEREMKLNYVGTIDVKLEQSNIFSEDAKNYDEYTNCWQIMSIKDYLFLNREIKLNSVEVMIGSGFFSNSYLVSYGRKLDKAVYNTKDYWECGYYVDFTFDETEYHSDVVYVYQTDRVIVGNIMYLM